MIRSNNRIELRGTCASAPVISHSGRDEAFYTFPIAVLRLSGVTDTINVIIREEAAKSGIISPGARLQVTGEIRSFNNKSGVGNRLVITVFAKRIEPSCDEDCNIAELAGTICKPPVLRITPMGREICDIMLAVNRRYGRSDYLPCIAWGHAAVAASNWVTGTKIRLSGRLQSRDYIKTADGVSVQKTAFEVSVSEMEGQTEKSPPDGCASGGSDIIRQD